MTESITPIVAAARRLVRALLKDSPHCPDPSFIGVVTRANCDTIATIEGFDIRIDRAPTPGALVARVYHAAAHMLCIQHGVSSHSGSGRHTQMFDLALEALNAPAEADEDEFLSTLNKSQRAALDDFYIQVQKRVRTRAPSKKTAYERGTLKCAHEGCTHQLTLRLSAIAKTRFLCVEHAVEMELTP